VHLLSRVQAGRLTQVFLNRCIDDQEEENESGLFLLLVCSRTHRLQSGFFLVAKKNLGYEVFFLGLFWAE